MDSAESLQPASKTTVVSPEQAVKQIGEIASIDEGRQIDCSERQDANAHSSRLESLEPASNVKVDSLSQNEKQPLEIVPTEEGMQID
jgi:hypothetical protein